MRCQKSQKKAPLSKHIIISTVDTGSRGLAKLSS